MSSSENLIFNPDNQHYYQISDTNHESWADAVTEANELGGYLVSIDDATELSLLQQSVDYTDQYWVGGEDNNVFAAATGNYYVAAATDDLSLPAIIEFDSIYSNQAYATADSSDLLLNPGTLTTASATGILTFGVADEGSILDIEEYTSLLPSELQYLWDTVSIEETAENEVTLSWQDEINLTELFDVGAFVPNLAIDTPTFVITDEASSSTYEFSGDITVGTEEFGLGTSFTKEGENQFSWNEISIADFSLNSLTEWLGDTVAGVDSFLGTSLPTIDLTITEEELEFSWQDDLNFTELFHLDSFLPNFTIADPTFAIASEDSTTSYEFSGDMAIGGEEFSLATSFTKEASQLNWEEISISDFSVSSLANWIGGAIDEVDSIFGDGLPTIDVTITEEQLDFAGTLDFANSNNEYLGWIHDNLNLDTLDVAFSYNTDGEIALAAGVSGNWKIIDTNDVDITLTDVVLGFEVSGGVGSREVALSLEAAAILDTDDTSLDLTGGIEFAVGTGGFEAEAYFALNAGESGWQNPFDLPDATIYSFGLQIGIGVAGFDSFGFRGDLIFGSYNFDAAFSVDLTNPNEFALAATLNSPISVMQLIAGPAASYALGQAADSSSFISDATDIMDEVLNINVVSIDSDDDGELDPLIYIVPEDTDIAGKTYEQGFSINAAVSAWGQEASVYFNANADTGEISGGLEIERIEIGIDNFYDDILVIEGSDVLDDSSNGTLVDGAIASNGKDATLVNADVDNGTLNLDGSGDYASVANDSELNFGTSSFAVEAWVYDDPNSAVDWNNAVSKKLGSGTANGWTLRIDNQDRPQFFLADGARSINVSSSTAIAEGEWYHLAGVVDRETNQAKLYVNGNLVASKSISSLGNLDSDGEFRIGTWNHNSDYWHGQIDDVRVWNTSRSSEEISANYQENLTGTESGLVANWNFDSSYVVDNTVQDVAASSVLDLDGNNDYVRIEDNAELDSITTEITVETWVKVDRFDRTWQAIVTKGDNSWRLHRNSRSNNLNFAISGIGSITSSTNVNDGQWHHVAAVYDGSQMRLYINGVLDAQRSASGAIPTNNYDVLIGENDQRRNRYFEGEIDDVRIWNTARSEEQILANYQATLTGEESGLVGYWNFDGTSVKNDTIKDIAVSDDNLNLDFKISEEESYLRGDGKITFLGQSIDAYIDAGTEGLEIAIATDNGVLSTDLSVTVDDSGFAASGGIDLDLDVDVDLGVLGTYKLVDFDVNANAEVEVGTDGFYSRFWGSFSLYGASVSFDLEIDVPISDLEALYDLLLADIVNEIESIGSDIFNTVGEWANAIADGVVEFAGDVADVAKDIYNATEEAFIAAAETLGETAEDIANGLSSAYNATEDAIAEFLDDAGYALDKISDVLISEFNATAEDISSALSSIGSTASEVAAILDSNFTLAANEMVSTLESFFNVGGNDMAKILKDVDYHIHTVLISVIDFYNLTPTPAARALDYAGYAIDEMAHAINYGAKWTTIAFRNVGFAVNDIAEAFKDAGRGIDFITSGLQIAYGYGATQLANVLESVNYAATAVADALSNVGYAVSEVGKALDDAYTLSANAMADALEGAGYAVNEVGNFLKDGLGYADDAVNSALKAAGYAASEVDDFMKDAFDWFKKPKY